MQPNQKRSRGMQGWGEVLPCCWSTLQSDLILVPSFFSPVGFLAVLRVKHKHPGITASLLQPTDPTCCYPVVGTTINAKGRLGHYLPQLAQSAPCGLQLSTSCTLLPFFSFCCKAPYHSVLNYPFARARHFLGQYGVKGFLNVILNVLWSLASMSDRLVQSISWLPQSQLSGPICQLDRRKAPVAPL
jgi:hypothetical protein